MKNVTSAWWPAALVVAAGGHCVAQEPRPADVEALAAELGRDPARDVEVLARLRAFGARAACVLPDLVAAPAHEDTAWIVELVRTVGELAPYRPAAFELDTGALQRRHVGAWMSGPRDQSDLDTAWRRLMARERFPRGAAVADLVEIARGRGAYRVELALELLAARGAAAREALPAVVERLDDPDPRILGTDRTVPVRNRAAAAVLAIDPTHAAAARARAVLAGAPPMRSRDPQVPDRVRQQLAELLAELDGGEHELALANLEALGELAVPTMVEALRQPQPPEVRDALIEVLRRLGARAAPAAPALRELLVELPVEHTARLLAALAATAPWSHDVVTVPVIGTSLAGVDLDGRPVPGVPELEHLNAILVASRELFARLSVDPTATTGELADLLADDDAAIRARALELLRQRGPAARDALPSLTVALDGQHPTLYVQKWKADGSTAVRPVDQTPILRALAAEAIVRVAPADSEIAARARRRLADRR